MKYTPRRHACSLLCLGILIFAAGCQTNETAARRPESQSHAGLLGEPIRLSGTSGDGAARGQDPPLHVVDLVFDVLRADVPAVTRRDSLKVWNHVDEMRVDGALAARLARNGLRVGAASPEAWPAIRTILEAAGTATGSDQFMAQRGLPLAIILAEVSEGESIFCHGRDSRLVGKSFSAGDKVLSLDYVLHPELDNCTDLRVSLEVRHNRGEMGWERRDGIIRQIPSFDRYVFEDLTALLTLRPGECLVIGPGEASGNGYLPGARFLTTEREGARYDTLLFITPRPFQWQRG